ncbi:Ig-like domain-containing protein, partial [Pseudahrensia aquimaris]
VLDLLGNDDDPDGDNANLTITEIDGQPIQPGETVDVANGTVTLNDDGTVTFTPEDGFTGDAVFEYTVEDEDGLTDTGTVTVAVSDNTVDAVDDDATTDFNTPVAIDVLGNDTDPEGDTFEVTDFDGTSANGGTITENADGTLNYTPADGFEGTDTFEYTITDANGNTDTATVTVTVGEDPNTPPDADSDFADTPVNTPVIIDVLNNDMDADGDTLTVT